MRLTSLLAVALVSGAILFSEIALTRYFSFRLWYHYAFMIISIALLGLSASATAMALARERLSRFPTTHVLGMSSAAFGICLVLALNLLGFLNDRFLAQVHTEGFQAFLFVASYWAVLFVPFFFAGCTISWAIQTSAGRVSSVYAFDLIGAGLGALCASKLLHVFHPEQALAFAAAAGLAGALLFVAGSQRGVVAVWALCGLGLALAVGSYYERGALLGARVTQSKGLAHDLAVGARLIATRPSTNGRVDATAAATWRFAWGLGDYDGPFPQQIRLRIDGDALTPLTRYDGDFSKWAFSDFMPSTLPYWIGNPKRVLLIGPGGGLDVVNAVNRGAEKVTGVEINARIIELVAGEFNEFAGGIYRDPRVEVIHSDGRNFVENTREQYDLVQLTLVDTFAAIASGALSLSEDFLYTREAFRAYLRVLSPDGMLALGRTQPEALSLVAMLHAATPEEEDDLATHLFLADHPRLLHSLIVLYKRSPLTPQEIDSGLEFVRQARLRLVYAPGHEAESHPEIVRFFRAADRDAFIAGYPSDIAPERDDRPFYFRASKWSALLGTYQPGRGNVLIILAVAVLFAFGLIVLPLFLTARDAVRGHQLHLAFFALIGLGFIVLELGLMTKFVLFLGHPVRSLSVTLFSLLAFSGLGSAASRALLGDASAGASARRLALPFLALVTLAVGYGLWLDDVFAGWMGIALPARIATAVALIAPLGFVMGMPLPLGLALLANEREELVLWAWGLNGVASVIGSVGCIALAHAAGYSSTFLVAAICYGVAMIALLRGAARKA
jgi:hypothetical protein